LCTLRTNTAAISAFPDRELDTIGDDEDMRLILNVIWLVFGGLLLALGYVIAGIICCILIITIPFGIASFRIANYALWPFGRTTVRNPTAGVASVIGNVIWLILAGWWLALGHLVSGIAQCITIIGIPLGLANFKLIPVSLFPLGVQIVDADDPLARV
jgi:uncharacterized membrane protein YccF (DUF307 family)